VRGDVFRVVLTGDDREQRGVRYCVVVQLTRLNLSTTLICPTSTSARPGLLHPTVDWDGTPTQVMVEQLKAVSTYKLGESVGHLLRQEMDDIDQALRLVLGLAA
jgi:mRNA interferase MazF